MSTQLDRLYSTTGRPPIPPEQLLRALLWKVPYGIEGERLLMEELDYNLLLPVVRRVDMNDPVWQPTAFKETGNGCSSVWRRGRGGPLRRAQSLACEAGLLSDEHFTPINNRTQLEA